MSTSLYAHTSGVPAKTYTWKAVCPLQLYETIVVSIYTHLFNAIRIYVYSAEIIQKEVTKSKTHVLLQRRWPQTPKGATKKNKELFIFTSPNASSDFLLLFVKNIGFQVCSTYFNLFLLISSCVYLQLTYNIITNLKILMFSISFQLQYKQAISQHKQNKSVQVCITSIS